MAKVDELPIGLRKPQDVKSKDSKEPEKIIDVKIKDTAIWTFPADKAENPFPKKLFVEHPKKDTPETEKFLNIEVKKGTWLSKIAMSAYDLKPEELVKASKIIADYNGIKDINKIKTGTVLKVPTSIKIGDKEYSMPAGNTDDVGKFVETHRTLIHAKRTKHAKHIKAAAAATAANAEPKITEHKTARVFPKLVNNKTLPISPEEAKNILSKNVNVVDTDATSTEAKKHPDVKLLKMGLDDYKKLHDLKSPKKQYYTVCDVISCKEYDPATFKPKDTGEQERASKKPAMFTVCGPLTCTQYESEKYYDHLL